MSKIFPYLIILRVHQYIKNAFIFLPLFFDMRIDEYDLLLKTFFVFVFFSLVASSVYIFNDYMDRKEDREHPKKKERPIASGRVTKRAAVIEMLFLLIAGLAGCIYIMPGFSWLIIIFYVFINVLYSVKLKHFAIIDIVIIASGFVIRLFIGAKVGDVILSHWIVLITFLLALFLALAKRRDDVIIFLEQGRKIRKSIDGYNLQVLDAGMIIMSSVVIVSYIMYTVSTDVIKRLGTDKLYFTVFFVILGILRYMQITFINKDSGSPTRILLKDKFIQFTIFGWIVSFSVLIYFKDLI